MPKERDKLNELLDIEGQDLMEYLTDHNTDGLVPGICMNPGCNNVEDVEKDCADGYCEDCGTQSIKSGYLLAGAI